MQIIKTLLTVFVFVLPLTLFSQSTYLNQGDKAVHLVERMEIKQQKNTDLNFSTVRPFQRKAIVQEVQFLDSARMGFKDSTGQDHYKDWTDLDLTSVDEYNIRSLLMNNSEWVNTPRA